MSDCVLGGIVKKNSLGSDLVGFSIGFKDKKTAQYYKDMFEFIVKSDDIKVEDRNGYYDKKGE